MASALNKARLDFRTTDEDKALIEKAARLAGQTLSKFAVPTLVERAREVIATHTSTQATARDWETINRLLASDEKPSRRLRLAARRYKKRKG